MITFTLCLLALIVGYFTYGRLMERVFGPDDRKTPALTKADGGLYSIAHLEDFHDSISQYCRIRSYFRSNHGSEIW